MGDVALYRVEALVLWTKPLGESDRLAGMLTPDHGRMRAVARGARRGKGQLSAAVQPFVHARFLLWKGRELDGISQAEILGPHQGLSLRLDVLAAAAYCCEIAQALSNEGQEASSLFALLAAAVDWLGAVPPGGNLPVLLRWFELGALGASGFAPRLLECARCGGPALGDSALFSPSAGGVLCANCSVGEGGVLLSANSLRALHYLAGCPWDALAGVRVGPRTMAKMAQATAAHLDAVLERPLRSRALLSLPEN